MQGDRSTGVTFETKDFKVTAACASGYTEVEQTLPEDELPTDQMQGPERSAGSGPRSGLKAVCRKREDEKMVDKSRMIYRIPINIPEASLLEQTAGNLLMGGTSNDGTDEEDKGQACFSDSLPPGENRSSRKRPKKKWRQPPAWKSMKAAEAVKETLMLEKGKNQEAAAQEETTQSLIPMPVMIMAFAIFVFVIFVRVINGG